MNAQKAERQKKDRDSASHMLNALAMSSLNVQPSSSLCRFNPSIMKKVRDICHFNLCLQMYLTQTLHKLMGSLIHSSISSRWRRALVDDLALHDPLLIPWAAGKGKSWFRRERLTLLPFDLANAFTAIALNIFRDFDEAKDILLSSN